MAAASSKQGEVAERLKAAVCKTPISLSAICVFLANLPLSNQTQGTPYVGLAPMMRRGLRTGSNRAPAARREHNGLNRYMWSMPVAEQRKRVRVAGFHGAAEGVVDEGSTLGPCVFEPCTRGSD